MAKVPNGVETLPKISIVWVGRTNVTDRQTTDRRQTDRRRHIANMNLSSRSLKSSWIAINRFSPEKCHKVHQLSMKDALRCALRGSGAYCIICPMLYVIAMGKIMSDRWASDGMRRTNNVEIVLLPDIYVLCECLIRPDHSDNAPYRLCPHDTTPHLTYVTHNLADMRTPAYPRSARKCLQISPVNLR